MSLSELQIVRKELSRIESAAWNLWKNMGSKKDDMFRQDWQKASDRLDKIEQKMKKRMEELIE